MSGPSRQIGEQSRTLPACCISNTCIAQANLNAHEDARFHSEGDVAATNQSAVGLSRRIATGASWSSAVVQHNSALS